VDTGRGRGDPWANNDRTDLRNAGANVVDEEVVIYGNLITGRSPRDLPAFCGALIDRLKAVAAG